MKKVIKLTESNLRKVIQESIKQVLKEGVDVVSKIQTLIDDANSAYMAVSKEFGDEYPLMDKKGNTYGLSGQIKLDGRGYIIIPFVDYTNGWSDHSSTEKIKVLQKQQGVVRIYNGDYFDEGWKDARKKLKRIIEDAQRYRQYTQGYNPEWDDSETPEQYKQNKENLRAFNKQIGRHAQSGVEYLEKKY